MNASKQAAVGAGRARAGDWRLWWNHLFEPSARVISRDERRQARLFSAITLGLIALGLLLDSAYRLLAPGSRANWAQTLTGVVLLTAAYGLSRTRFYRQAAVLTVLISAVAVLSIASLDPHAALTGFLDYLAITLVLGSLFLRLRDLALLIGLLVSGILILPLTGLAVSYTELLVAPVSFVLGLGVIMMLATRHRDLLERDRVADLRQANERAQTEAARAHALLRVAERLNAQLDQETLLAAIADETAAALKAPLVALALYDAARDELRLAAAVGWPEAERDTATITRAVFEQLVAGHGPAVIADEHRLRRLPGAEHLGELGVRGLALASMDYEGELIGSLSVMAAGEARPFTEDDRLLLKGLADQAALAIVNTRLYKEAHRRLQRLQALRAIDEAITANQSIHATLDVLLRQITAQLGVDAVTVLLMDSETRTLHYAAARGFHTDALRHTRLRLGDGNAGRAALERTIVAIPDLAAAPGSFTYAPAFGREGFRAYYAAPLVAKDQVKGVLEVFHRSRVEPDPEWLAFLEALAGQAAIAIDNSTLVDDLQRSNRELAQAYEATIEGWSHALDLRDKETEGHTQRVTQMTLQLARAMGMSEAELVHLRRGALLHDIGKMGVPDRILLKPGPLTDDEWVIMRQHPSYALEMLAPIDYLRPALDIPYGHHEKWDGTGYPRKLQGEAIPLAARVFAVVDVWDALRSDRPYRPAWPEAKVREYLRSEAGRHFDPAVVEAFMGLVDEA